jgi:hypothetical protein
LRDVAAAMTEARLSEIIARATPPYDAGSAWS